MPHLPLAKRDRNFNEVVLGYDNKAAVEEAKRCLHCYREDERIMRGYIKERAYMISVLQ